MFNEEHRRVGVRPDEECGHLEVRDPRTRAIGGEVKTPEVIGLAEQHRTKCQLVRVSRQSRSVLPLVLVPRGGRQRDLHDLISRFPVGVRVLDAVVL